MAKQTRRGGVPNVPRDTGGKATGRGQGGSRPVSPAVARTRKGAASAQGRGK